MFDEEILHRYGTPLEPLHEDEVPSKKPVHLEDQIVTDENGKRRFHGAFTGGFSAGFWNTVGSLEGWTPQSFKSSRSEKAEQRQRQRPEDFMDQEDLGEFGIAPQGIQTRDEFRKEVDEGRKRKLMQPSCGPIPGTPVLELLLKPVKDKVAVRILKSMGWRPGQGVGPRQSKKNKKRTRQHNQRELYLMERYGIGHGEAYTSNSVADDSANDSSASDDTDEEITFAPDDYDPSICLIKNNRYGLGYTGLSREPVLSKGAKPTAAEHINLFGPMEVLDKHNKKLSITGQAFGVGAFEEEDDDIYERDDLTKYDFSLEKQKSQKKSTSHVQDHTIIDGFVAANNNVQYNPPFKVELPPDFKPRNWALRQSRFAPLDPERANDLNLEKDFRKCGLGRHELTPQQRGDILGEKPSSSRKEQPNLHENKQTYTSREERSRNLLERISAKSSNFTHGGVITAEGEEKPKLPNEDVEVAVQLENNVLQAKANNITRDLGKYELSLRIQGVRQRGNNSSYVSTSTPLSSFKPFLGDDAKQKRYDQFLAANLRIEDEISSFLRTIQPVHLSEWDREMEKKEFIQARKLYKPLDGIMSDRFISEATVQTEKPLPVEEHKNTVENEVVMVRTKTLWKPSSLLCKRFNIAEPYGGKMVEDKKPTKSKLSVFDYLESSINTKANFQTPVIIPRHIEKPKLLIKESRPAEHVEATATETKDIVLKTVDALVPMKEATTVVKHLRYVPKTDLEKRVEESKNMPASKKVELFRAIFEDSDEEEQKGDDLTQATETTELTKRNATLVTPSLANPTSAAAANMLRNTSPPRGIFAALFTTIDRKESVTSTSHQTELEETKRPNEAISTSKITFKPRCDRLQRKSETIEPQTDIFGPKIPDQLKKSSETKESIVDEKLFKLFEKHKSSKYHSSVDLNDEWVEKKDEDSSDSSSSSSRKRKSKKKNRDKKHKKKDKKKSKKKSSKSHKSKKK